MGIKVCQFTSPPSTARQKRTMVKIYIKKNWGQFVYLILLFHWRAILFYYIYLFAFCSFYWRNHFIYPPRLPDYQNHAFSYSLYSYSSLYWSLFTHFIDWLTLSIHAADVSTKITRSLACFTHIHLTILINRFSLSVHFSLITTHNFLTGFIYPPESVAHLCTLLIFISLYVFIFFL